MTKLNNRLTNTEVEKLKAKKEAYNSRSDGEGLYMRIFPNGRKVWRLKYTKPSTNNRTNISLGDYPALTLLKPERGSEKSKPY